MERHARRTRRAGAAGTLFLCILAALCVSTVLGGTDPGDVSALNSMYTGLGNDVRLTHWVQSAGDPCGEQWLGVTCQGSSVTAIKLPSFGLQGKVEGWVLQKFSKLSVLDLSRNNFGTDLPNMFPPQLTVLDLSFNQFTGTFPYLLINVNTLKSIKLSNNALEGSLNDQVFSKLVNLVTLDLSNNDFSGPIPASVGDMVSLQNLYLQNNKLTGSLPATLSNLVSLQVFDVSNNDLTGYLPPNFNPRTFNVQGNQISQQAPPPPPYTPPPPPKHTPRPVPPSASSGSSSPFSGARIAGIAVAIILALTAAGIAVWFFRLRKRLERIKASDLEANNNHSGGNGGSSRRAWFLPLKATGKEKPTKVKVFEPDTKEKKGTDSPKIKAQPPVKTLKAPPAFNDSDPGLRKAFTGKVNKSTIAATAFSVADLQAATDSFSLENVLGDGVLGRVYRAELPDGQVLAVKKLDTRASMVRNEDDFLNVVEGLSRLQHANAAALVGYCVEHEQRLLVYKYLGRGTLHELLHADEVENHKGLSWNMRVKIALGAARALEYLHEVCSPPVVHRNFKSANILLDDELNPHVTDCGLEALAPSGSESQVSVQILGTAGYSAPEYAMSGTYTVKSDVYSFGVVMLELLTGRKPLDSSRPRSEQSLVRWATPQLHDIDALARMVDPALEGVYPAKSLSRLADIVALCVQPEPEFRPPMSEVVQSLMRLMQRATLSKRRTKSEASDSLADIQESYEYSN